MKNILFILCFLPLIAAAELTPSKPTYSVLGKIVLDERGVVTNDPRQITRLNVAEINLTNARLANMKRNLKNSWNLRRNGAIARATNNPRLVK